MRSIALAVVAGAAAITLSFPAPAEDGWGKIGASRPASWFDLRAAVADMKPADPSRFEKPFAAVSKQAPAAVAVIQLPVDPDKIAVPGAFIAAFGETLEATRNAAASDTMVNAALQAKGFAPDDVLALTRTGDGGVAVFVGAAG
jgi:hypothetical protein